MVGKRLDAKYIVYINVFICALVLFFLLLEVLFVDVYAVLFKPAKYYFVTRGNEIGQFNEVGLFNNAMGFESRFSFGVFNIPRTSSVFLEQVSLANYSIVLSIFIATFYSHLKRWYLFLFMFTVVLIVLSNNSRTASVLIALVFVGYFIFPYLPRYFNSLFPFFILSLSTVFYYFFSHIEGDNLLGRINLGMKYLYGLSTYDLVGNGLNKIERLYDSGYAYIVSANTILGAIAIYFFVSFTLKQYTFIAKRLACYVSMFFFVALVTGGNAIYSMKISALLWLIVGGVYRMENYNCCRGGYFEKSV